METRPLAHSRAWAWAYVGSSPRRSCERSSACCGVEGSYMSPKRYHASEASS
jgi:hypothetical protein